MSKTRISEAQGNAEALVRRDAPYTAASGASFAAQWDYHRREPDDLPDAVRMVRRAYADEVPTKLHEGYTSIGEGGTPKMTARAEGYLFGRDDADDTPKDRSGTEPAVSYLLTPFREALRRMSHGQQIDRDRAAIVHAVAIGSEPAVKAAISQGIKVCWAGVVAEDALRMFLRNMTDLKLSTPREGVAQ